MLKFVQRICLLSVKLTRFLLTANIEQYFLYNGVLYTILGVITWITVGRVRAFLCNVPPQVALGGIGCSNCADNLLMCDKSDCWRQAVNLTVHQNSMTPDAPFFQARVTSALDIDCNRIVRTSLGPIPMLNGIISKSASSGGSAPTPSCRLFHCKVLLNSVLRDQNTDLPGLPGDTCTDVWDLKHGMTKTTCTCEPTVQAFTLEDSIRFADFCGSMASELNSMAMYQQNLRKSKDECYADTVIGYFERKLVTNPQDVQNAFNNRNCTYLTMQAFTVFEWFTLMLAETNLYNNGLTPNRFQVPSTCVLDYCAVFNETLYSSTCVWSTSPYLLAMTQADVAAVNNNCAGMGFTAQRVCSIVGRGPAVCEQFYTPSPAPAVVATTTTGAGGASARRLDEEEGSPGVAHLGLAAVGGATPEPCSGGDEDGLCSPSSSDVARALHSGLGGGLDLSKPTIYHPRMAPFPRPIWPRDSPALLAAEQLGSSSASSPRLQERRLQTSPTPAPSSTDGEDWTVSDYSQCTCLQQCVEGVQHRSVSCPSGMRCKEPKPPTSQPCVCRPCSDCQVDFILKGMACTYWFQGTSSLLLCMAFYTVSSLTEDDMSEMRCTTKILGCFCKAWPVLVRIGVYVCLLFVGFFAMAVIPGTGFMNDCHAVDALVLLTICSGVCFVLQLVAGIVMKRKKTMPPWLYNSVKEGWATVVMTPIRAIGP